MVAGNTVEELRAELRQIEKELAELRQTVAEQRRRIGDRWDGPTDVEDRAAAITAAEEQEAVIGVLEGRREALRRRLGEG